MPRITNLAGFEDESENLLTILDQAPALWVDLVHSGYEVSTPDVLGRSGPDGLSWHLEVSASSCRAYMWCQRSGAYLGKTYLVTGVPAVAVAEARRLLELQAREEGLSGATRSKQPEVEHVAT